MTIQIRPFKNSDIDSFLAQHLTNRNRAYLEWCTSYRSVEHLFLVAYLEDTIVGYYWTIPTPLKIGDRMVLSYAGDLFVHPDHRKKNYSVLNLLVRAFNDEAKKRKGILVGFPTYRLLKYYTRKIKYSPLKHIPRYVCVLRVVYVFERIFKVRWLVQVLAYFFQPLWRFWLFKTKRYPKDVEIKEIHAFDERFNDLWEKASKVHKIIAMRDAEYLNWRYTKDPSQRYVIFAAESNNEILGYIILKPYDEKNKQTGLILDIFGIQDKTVTQALFLRAMEYFDKEGLDKVELYVSDNYYERVLLSLEFRKRNNHPKAANLLMAICYSNFIDPNYFGRADHWFITTTDMLLS